MKRTVAPSRVFIACCLLPVACLLLPFVTYGFPHRRHRDAVAAAAHAGCSIVAEIRGTASQPPARKRYVA